jgi:predicted esterase
MNDPRVVRAARVLRVLLIASPLVGLTALGAQSSTALDKAFADFWKADDARGAERVVDRIIKTGIDFSTAYTRLKAGRPYAKEKTGEFPMRFTGNAGVLFENRVEIPDEYVPTRPWTLRVQLHGGVSRPAATTGASSEDESSAQGGGRPTPAAPPRRENRIRGENQIYIYPSGFAGAEWWHAVQIENILRLVDRIKRKYNVDESRVYMTGVSDGGTGTYYMAMKDPTVWSAFLPLNGSIKVLMNPDVRAEGELFSTNLANRPFYIVSGGRDPLYPARDVQTHVAAFQRIGVPLVFRPQPDAGHDTSWWPYERSLFEQFVKQKPREPHPARVSWQTESTDRFNRADWLVIDRLGMGSADYDFEPVDIFSHRRPSGRVDVSRDGNAFDAQTRGVKEFTILLSPDAIDFSQPVRLRVNGRDVFDGVVKRDLAVLLKWAARDNDRVRLYGAELKVSVP